MKRVTAYILFVILGLAPFVLAVDQSHTNSAPRTAEENKKNSKKAWEKYSKQQKKTEKKEQKAQEKARKSLEKDHPTGASGAEQRGVTGHTSSAPPPKRTEFVD